MQGAPGWVSPNESGLDRILSAKHSDIYPGEEEFAFIQKMVANVEKALKMVSDVLSEEKDGAGEK